MPQESRIPVLTCPLCGRPDEAAAMTIVAIPHASPVWPQSVTICQSCCLAVMNGVQRELDDYNQGVIGDGDFHFGLVERSDAEPVANGVAAQESAEHQADHDGATESGGKSSAPGANRSRAKSKDRESEA